MGINHVVWHFCRVATQCPLPGSCILRKPQWRRNKRHLEFFNSLLMPMLGTWEDPGWRAMGFHPQRAAAPLAADWHTFLIIRVGLLPKPFGIKRTCSCSDLTTNWWCDVSKPFFGYQFPLLLTQGWSGGIELDSKDVKGEALCQEFFSSCICACQNTTRSWRSSSMP